MLHMAVGESLGSDAIGVLASLPPALRWRSSRMQILMTSSHGRGRHRSAWLRCRRCGVGRPGPTPPATCAARRCWRCRRCCRRFARRPPPPPPSTVGLGRASNAPRLSCRRSPGATGGCRTPHAPPRAVAAAPGQLSRPVPRCRVGVPVPIVDSPVVRPHLLPRRPRQCGCGRGRRQQRASRRGARRHHCCGRAGATVPGRHAQRNCQALHQRLGRWRRQAEGLDLRKALGALLLRPCRVLPLEH